MSESPVTSGMVFHPRPIIEVDGNRHELLQSQLLRMDLAEREEGLSALELGFLNSSSGEQTGVDFTFEDGRLLTLGKSIRILGGDVNDPMELFRGKISGIEFVMDSGQPPELVVLAEDALQWGRMSRRTKLHPQGSVGDLVTAVAQELGVRPRVDGLSQQVGEELQYNESDLAFLRRVLRRYGGDLHMAEDELRAYAVQGSQRGTVTLEAGSQLRRVRALADLADQVTSVSCSGWDFASGATIAVTSDASPSGPGSGTSGDQFLQRTFNNRTEHLGIRGLRDSQEGQVLANVEFSRRVRRFVRVEAVADGNPAIRVGSHVGLTGIGRRFENSYYVTSVHHRYNGEQGYTTEFEAESSFWRG